jgi:hypothetical protein
MHRALHRREIRLIGEWAGTACRAASDRGVCDSYDVPPQRGWAIGIAHADSVRSRARAKQGFYASQKNIICLLVDECVRKYFI